MKDLKNLKTGIKNSQIKFGIKEADDFELDYFDLVEVSLDVVPQGGFTPSEIRDRNRIQDSIDLARDGKTVKGEEKVAKFEDADWKNLKKVVNSSRWMIRHKDLQKFLDIFKEKETE